MCIRDRPSGTSAFVTILLTLLGSVALGVLFSTLLAVACINFKAVSYTHLDVYKRQVEFGHLIPLLYVGPDALHDEIERHLIVPALGDDDVGIALGRLDEHLCLLYTSRCV